MYRRTPKPSVSETGRLFVIEGKNDYLIIGIVLLLLSFFIFGTFFFR